ncbi:MAG: hypothetical protein R3Y33_03725 [Clostridia bacterium]
MIYTIKNEFISLSVKKMGAELNSIKIGEREYMWQGDPDVWAGQAPLLFPLVGPMHSKTIGGLASEMNNHGFLKETEFSLASQSESEIVLACQASEKTQNLYPFNFKIEVKFALVGKTVESSYTVFNNDEREMVYSFGLHPAFALDLENLKLTDYYIEFGKKETLDRCMFFDDGVSFDIKENVVNNDTKLEFYDELLEKTIVFKDIDFSEVKFCNKKEGALFNFKFDGFKIFAMWQKPQSAYLCLEPWLGYNGPTPHTETVEENTSVTFLEPGKSDTYKMSIEF